ncbi:MAG: hypothetical protein EB168_11765, partial [Euryarchaeota archaeon]|nr:hypothetical protein [Euryarchaeota archaeon]
FWLDDETEDGVLNGSESVIPPDTEVDFADIPKLKFVSEEHGFGSPYTGFTFEVHDGVEYSATSWTMTIDVTNVNDRPVGQDNTIIVPEDTAFALISANFPHSDIEDDPLVQLRLQAATAGTLWVDSNSNRVLDDGELSVTNFMVVEGDDIARLTFLADLNMNGAAYSTVEFEVHDGTEYSVARNTLTIDVTAINDAPTSADNTINASEDVPYVFSLESFPYADVEDQPIDRMRLQAVTNGTLWVDTNGDGLLDGGEIAVANSSVVMADDIPKLTFLADEHEFGDSYATFQYEVHDGDAISAAIYTMTINVASVNDLPTSDDATVTAVEDTVFTFLSSNFTYADQEGDAFSAIRVSARWIR